MHNSLWLAAFKENLQNDNHDLIMNHMTNLFIIRTKTLPDRHMYVSYCFTMTDISIIGKICTLNNNCPLNPPNHNMAKYKILFSRYVGTGLFVTEHSRKHVVRFRFFFFSPLKMKCKFPTKLWLCVTVSFKLTTVWVSGFASHLLSSASRSNHIWSALLSFITHFSTEIQEKQTTAVYWC